MKSLSLKCSLITRKQINYIHIIKILICLSFLITPIRIKVYWEVNPFNLPQVFNHIVNSISNPGEVYESKLEFESGFLVYVNMFLSAIIYITLSAGLFYFKKIETKSRILITILFIFEILIPLGQGVRKGVLDALLLLFFMIVASNPEFILEKKKIRKVAGTVIAVTTLFLLYFIYSNMSRYKLTDMTVLTEGSNMFSSVKPFYKNWPPMIIVLICSIQAYACQGYYALSIALTLPYEFCYFLGSSWFGINLSNRLGIDAFSQTYIARLEHFGIDSTINWHSIYTWLANDMSFIFVPFFIFFIGFYLAKSWNDTLCQRSIYAPAAFFMFSVATFYSFANNQVFSLMFIPFFLIFILWSIDRKRRIRLI